MSAIQTEARGADLAMIHQLLTEQRTRRLDLVVSPSMFSAEGAQIAIRAGESTQLIGENGITDAAGLYRPTVVGHEGLAGLLGIHGGYLKKLAADRPDLYAANVNGMLHGLRDYGWPGEDGISPDSQVIYPPYRGNILLRLLKGDDEGEGVLRAALSPRFRIIDNLDVATAIMDGLERAGVNAVPDRCDLTDRRMYLRFVCPEVAALAPNLLKGYRSPLSEDGEDGRPVRAGMKLVADGRHGGWTVPQALAAAAAEGQGYPEGQEPVVFAGFIASNSDVGGGARWLIPQIRVKVCRNGLTLMAEGDKKIHLGTVQEEGVVSWSAETLERELALITSQTADLVARYTSQEFLDEQVAKIESLAGVPLKDPEPVILNVTKAAGFTVAESKGVWEHFLAGGTRDVGGLGNAITSVSQTLENADRAAELDARALPVMQSAARIAG